MAQTGFTPIQLYRTTTAAAVPSAGNLADGELAINTNDGRLFYKDSGGVVRTMASSASTSGVFAPGTVSAPGITFTGDTNTGIYSPAADTIAFTEGGVESMRIDASGNVRMGDASAAGTSGRFIDVYNLGADTNSYSIMRLITQEVATSNSTAVDIVKYKNGAFALNNNDTNAATFTAFGVSGSERMRITSAGNVGIGTSSPTARMTVNGILNFGNSAGVAMSVSNDFGGNTLLTLAEGSSGLRVVNSTNSAEHVRIDASGNVGIGTSGPTTRLTVAVGAADSINGILVSGGAVNKTVMLRPSMGAGSNNGIVQTGDGGIIFDGGTVDTGAFVIAPWATATSGIRIVGSTGNVGIGTASPASRLDVNGVIRDSKGDVRSIPQNAQTGAYTLVVGDAGRHISITTGGVTVPASVFSIGDAVTIFNNSGSNQTITQGGSVTLRQAGTANTGNRTLAQYGVCTILCVASNTFVISGAGLT